MGARVIVLIKSLEALATVMQGGRSSGGSF